VSVRDGVAGFEEAIAAGFPESWIFCPGWSAVGLTEGFAEISELTETLYCLEMLANVSPGRMVWVLPERNDGAWATVLFGDEVAATLALAEDPGSLSFWPGWMTEDDFRPFAFMRLANEQEFLRAIRSRLSPDRTT
jgi:hypothetical protein